MELARRVPSTEVLDELIAALELDDPTADTWRALVEAVRPTEPTQGQGSLYGLAWSRLSRANNAVVLAPRRATPGEELTEYRALNPSHSTCVTSPRDCRPCNARRSRLRVSSER